MREKPNLLIPKVVYKIRREHYIFWEISRVARGLPKTFTYSNWDETAVQLCLKSIENDVPCGLGGKNGL